MRIFSVIVLTAVCLLFCGAASTPEKSYELPIIMYHSVNKYNTGDYVIHPDKLESDLQWLSAHNYTGIFSSELISFTEGKKDLPEKPVIIFFDDGFYNNLIYALPLLEKYNFKAMIAIVGEYCDNEKGQRQSVYYSYLNWEQVKEVSESGLIEIVSHTYFLHRYGIKNKTLLKEKNESEKEYCDRMYADSEKLSEKIKEATGKYPDSFCYPYGRYSAASEKLLNKLGFKATYTCNEHINKVMRGKALSLLGRYNRSGKYSTQYFFREKMKLK